jgi:hypothetical protein
MTELGDNVLPLFKTYEEMHADECEIHKQHYDDWHAAYRRWDLVNAALADDETELHKLAAGDTELQLAKSEAQRLKKQHGGIAEFLADGELASKLRSLVEKRNERLYGLGALAKRSMRFASAQARKNYGPGATSLPPAS